MHDTLGYFQQDPIYRRYHHHELTFSLMYAFSENFILPLSHDEVVHGKGSLYSKMAGRPLAEAGEPARPLRLHVGAPRQEAPVHGRRARAGGRVEPRALARLAPAGAARARRASRRWCATSTTPTANEPALWEVDSDPSGFYWLEPNDADSNVVAFARASKDGERVLVFVANLSPVPRGPYRLGLPRATRWREVLNTDSTFYGGSDVGNLGEIKPEPIPWHDQPFSAELTLPPLAAMWLVPDED